MSERTLPSILARLRRRFVLIAGIAGIGWGLLLALVVLCAGVWLDLIVELSSGMRLFFEIGAVIAAVGLFLWFAVRSVNRSSTALLARRLDDVGHAGGQIVSGVDLQQSTTEFPWSINPDLSSGLSRLAVDRATELASNVPQSSAVPVKPAGRSLVTLLGCLAAVGLLVLLMPTLAWTQWLRFSQPFRDTPPFSRYQLTVDPADAEVLYGGGLDIHLTVDGPPFETADLVIEREPEEAGQPSSSDRETLPMFRDVDGRWQTSLADIRRPFRYRAQVETARTRWFDVKVISVPQIETVQFRVSPPDYAQQADYRGELPPGGLTGLPGTQVQLWVKSNRPLAGGRLKLIAGDQSRDVKLETNPQQPNEVTGKFRIAQSGRIEVSVMDVDGQSSVAPYVAPITLLQDERPFVRLLGPRAVSFATPTAMLPVVISAEDDYGISRLQLFRSLNDSRALPLDLPVAEPPRTRADVSTYLPLAEYGLTAGDEIKLFARVEDTDIAGGSGIDADPAFGKGAESSVAIVRIIAQEEYDRLQRARDGMQMMLSKYQQAQRRMENAAAEMETLRKKSKEEDAKSPVSAAQRQQLQQMAQMLKQQQEMLRKLSKTELPYELEKQLSKFLERQADQLQRLMKRTKELEKQEMLSQEELQQALEEMLKSLGKDREQLDNEVMKPLRTLAGALKLSKDESRFVKLYRRQRELAIRLKSAFSARDDADDPAAKSRMRDLEDEQRGIRAALKQLLLDIEEHALSLPDDEELDELRKSAFEFVEAVRESGASAAMTEAETALSEFDGDGAHKAAKRAADILEKFLKKCEGMGANGAAGAACKRFQPGTGTGESMRQTLQQLLRDAGALPGQGSGAGQGAGNGYSMQRSTMDNVGLYGGLPGLEQQSMSAGDGMSTRERAGNQGRVHSQSRPAGHRAGARATSATGAAGNVEAAVPLKYRRKVGRYFQRIADETSTAP